MTDTLDKPVIRNKGGRFVKGTGRSPLAGWRKSGGPGSPKKLLSDLRAYIAVLCEREGMPFKDPVEALAYIAITGRDPLEAEINKLLGENSPFHPSRVEQVARDGKRVRVAGFLPMEVRIDCLKAVAAYARPKLSMIEIAQEGDEQAAEAREQAKMLSADPEIRELLDKVAERAAAAEAEAGADAAE